MSTSNPMHSRCGLEDCDCGYVIERLVMRLEEIAKGEGRFNRDHLTHCTNTVEDMQALAVNAIEWARTELER